MIGQLPFAAATELELFHLHTSAVFPSAVTKRPDLPPAIDAILARACAKDRALRFSTCEEFDAAIAGSLQITRSVPPTIMATQGLPSIPPPEVLPPGVSRSSSVARTLSDAPLVPPPPAPRRRSGKKIALAVSGAVLLLAGGVVGVLFATGTFDEEGSPLAPLPQAKRVASPPLP